jgi:spoIIIJ-associated protein
MENEIKQQVETIAREFLDKISLVAAQVEVQEPGQGQFRLAIQTDEPRLYIGEGGSNLSDIQHLFRLVARRKLNLATPLFIDVDINNYKDAKIQYLKQTARQAADDVMITKITKSLRPMNSYERRVVHSELSLRGDVATESQGEGPDRHIMIKPKSII